MLVGSYESYKNSGLSWLGTVPEHWNILALHFAARLNSGEAITALQFNGDGVYPVFGGNGYRGNSDRFTHDGTYVLIGRQGALCGNVNIAKGKFFASEHAIVVSPSMDFDPHWMAYNLQAMNLGQYSVSAAQPGLSAEVIGRLKIVFPPLKEQCAIARFVDFKTAQIDVLIAKKKALLEKLAEKRTAVISHAVTQGIEASTGEKKSEALWFDNIPSHWRIMRIARVVEKFEQGWSPSCEDREAAAGEWGILKSGCVNLGTFQESQHKTLPSGIDPMSGLEVKSGDVLMCRASGSKHLIGSVARVETCRPRLMFSDKTYRITLDQSLIDPEFFVFVMKSQYMRDQIELSISGADGLANNIPQSSVKAYQVVVPSVSEQREIVFNLRKIDEDQKKQSAKVAEAVERLKEYRSALITNAVTGKIDVRGFQVPADADAITECNV